jgi:hypothetical protein
MACASEDPSWSFASPTMKSCPTRCPSVMPAKTRWTHETLGLGEGDGGDCVLGGGVVGDGPLGVGVATGVPPDPQPTTIRNANVAAALIPPGTLLIRPGRTSLILSAKDAPIGRAVGSP